MLSWSFVHRSQHCYWSKKDEISNCWVTFYCSQIFTNKQGTYPQQSLHTFRSLKRNLFLSFIFLIHSVLTIFNFSKINYSNPSSSWLNRFSFSMVTSPDDWKLITVSDKWRTSRTARARVGGDNTTFYERTSHTATCVQDKHDRHKDTKIDTKIQDTNYKDNTLV